MFNIPKIENAQFYVDKAYRSTLTVNIASGLIMKNVRERKKRLEVKRMSMYARTLRHDMDDIVSSIPVIDELPEFYKELIDVTIGTVKLKQAVQPLRWVQEKLSRMEGDYTKMIERETSVSAIVNAKKSFYGRTNSIMKKISKSFSFLEGVRRKMREFPTIRTKMPTICICGFPNVGKSTLLSKITTAKPKIEPYAFTTKSIMLGYIGGQVQMIDTPGTFKDIFYKMNWIEKQSYLAVKYLGEALIYVFDITETCGFIVDDQFALFESMRAKFPEKKFLVYISKSDIASPEDIENFIKKHNLSDVFSDSKKLKEYIVENFKNTE